MEHIGFQEWSFECTCQNFKSWVIRLVIGKILYLGTFAIFNAIGYIFSAVSKWPNIEQLMSPSGHIV